jgi:anti-sigma regulatory factor (Ser/Thr protein kinase)
MSAFIESAELVVSELVTNAIKVTGGLGLEDRERYSHEPRSVHYEDLAQLGSVRFRLSSDRVRLLIEVWDKSEEPPVAGTPDLESESGRGLLLVTSLCRRWGYYRPADVTTGSARLHWSAGRGQSVRLPGGKVVWGEMVEP